MLLSQIKEDLQKTRQVLLKEQPDNPKFLPSYQMSQNEAVNKLKTLEEEFKNTISKITQITLVHAPQHVIPNNSLVFDHLAFAKELARVSLPSLKMGTQVTSFQVASMNAMIEDICLKLGVNSQLCPRLYMDADFARIVNTEDEYVAVVESMVERMLKNLGTDLEGHVLQVLYTIHDLYSRAESLPLADEQVNAVVFVPKLSEPLISEYNKWFDKKVKTASMTQTRVDTFLTSTSDVDLLVNTLTNSLPNNVKNKKKK